MKRRTFISQSLATTALVATSSFNLLDFDAKKEKKITILHTNDTHSHIDALPKNDPKNPNMGGVARRAAIIEKIRKEEENVLLLDAGDIFQGTPYFNYYGGALEFQLMSMMGYDVATLGNHDFDNGIDGFHMQLHHATFDFVSANYDFKNTVLNDLVKPYKIITKSGVKIGIFGLGVELNGLVDKKLYKETVYLDPIEIAQDYTKKLRYENQCDLVICLSHLGYQYKNEPNKISDTILAEKTKDIDLIIGGHTHTFLEKPTVKKNCDGKDVLINQVGCYGIQLGRIDFYVSSEKNKVTIQNGIDVR